MRNTLTEPTWAEPREPRSPWIQGGFVSSFGRPSVVRIPKPYAPFLDTRPIDPR